MVRMKQKIKDRTNAIKKGITIEVKNPNLNVKPDMTISVSANEKVPLEDIIRFVKEKAPWIVKNVEYFKDVQPEHVSGKKYVSGETFYWMRKLLGSCSVRGIEEY